MERTIDVVVTWAGTPLSVARLAPGQQFTLGHSASGDGDRHFLCDHESIPSARHPLVEHAGDGVVVRTAAGMALVVDGAPLSSPEVKLSLQARAVVDVGALRVSVAADRRAPRALDRLRDVIDGRLLRLSGAALAIHAGLVVALLVTRAPDPVDPLVQSVQRYTQTLSTVRPPPKRLEHAKLEQAKPQQASSSPAAPRKASKNDKTRRTNRELALNAIHELFGGAAAATSEVFGAGRPGMIAETLRNTSGASEASMALRPGPGGGGGRQTGIGVLDGVRLGTGTFDGPPNIDLLGAGKRHVTVKSDAPPIHEDGLTREEIQRVVSRVMSQIKFCYEKELNKQPDLSGKLVTTWIVGPSGKVTSANLASSTLRKPGGDAVGGCVVRILSRLEFPKPRGGGQVVVTYPFILDLAGE